MINNDIIKKIKYGRLKPEEKWFIDILWNLKEYTSDKYTDRIYYKKDKELLFEYNQKNGYFHCSYEKIWSVFESKFNLNYNEISSLIKGMVEEHLKLRSVTPQYYKGFSNTRLEEHLKLRSVTPVFQDNI
jgi:hypothetical protein